MEVVPEAIAVTIPALVIVAKAGLDDVHDVCVETSTLAVVTACACPVSPTPSSVGNTITPSVVDVGSVGATGLVDGDPPPQAATTPHVTIPMPSHRVAELVDISRLLIRN